MSKDPAFLFYPGDYIAGTMGMTFEEKGAYMELLMMQFSRGHMTSHMIDQVVGQLWDKINHTSHWSFGRYPIPFPKPSVKTPCPPFLRKVTVAFETILPILSDIISNSNYK